MNDLSEQDFTQTMHKMNLIRAYWFKEQAEEAPIITMLLKEWTQIEDITVAGERTFKDDPGPDNCDRFTSDDEYKVQRGYRFVDDPRGPEKNYWFSLKDRFKTRVGALSANGEVLARTQIWLIFDKLPPKQADKLLNTDRPFGEVFQNSGMWRQRVTVSLSEWLLEPEHVPHPDDTFLTLESKIYLKDTLVGFVCERFPTSLLAFKPELLQPAFARLLTEVSITPEKRNSTGS